MSRKNYFRTILIALAMITGLGAATMAQEYAQIAITTTSANLRFTVAIHATYHGEQIFANGVEIENNTSISVPTKNGRVVITTSLQRQLLF